MGQLPNDWGLEEAAPWSRPARHLTFGVFRYLAVAARVHLPDGPGVLVRNISKTRPEDHVEEPCEEHFSTFSEEGAGAASLRGARAAVAARARALAQQEYDAWTLAEVLG